jgi:hypothetical protein
LRVCSLFCNERCLASTCLAAKRNTLAAEHQNEMMAIHHTHAAKNY